MTSILTTLGLCLPLPTETSPPSHIATYLLIQYFWAHAVTSTRGLKFHFKLDHQVSPREDLTKYGPRAVASGKLTQAQLDMLRRNESAHANTVEGYAWFASAMILAQVAGVSPTEINFAGTAYCVARVAYFVTYLTATTHRGSLPRGLIWWICNVVCARLVWIAGREIVAKTGGV